MWLIYSADISVFFGRIPQHIGAIYPSWYKFKNSIELEIRVLHMQQFVESLFHFLVLWDRQLPRHCFDSPHRWSVVCYCTASFTSYWKTQCFSSHRLGYLTYWTCLIWIVKQAHLILCQGYFPKKSSAYQTQNSHSKWCISWGLGDWQPHPLWFMTVPLVDIRSYRERVCVCVYIYIYIYIFI
jgi:hypothetical protein